MNKKLILILSIFLVLPLFSALDPQLPYCQGGDSELIICFGDSELTFLAGLPTPESRGGPGVLIGAEQTTTDKEEVKEEIEKPSVLSLIRNKILEGLSSIGNKIWEGNPKGGVLVLFLVIMVVGFFGWRYKGFEKLKRFRERNKMKRIEGRKLEEGWK